MGKPRRRGSSRGRRLPKVLRRDEWDAVLQAADTDRSQPFLGLRDQAICALFLFSGIRCGELVALKIGDVDLERRQVRVIGKGDKERIAAVGPEAVDLLEAYLQVWPTGPDRTDPPPDAPLFLSRQGGIHALSAAQVRRLVKAAGGKAGHGESLHPHTFRHSHATRLFERGHNLFKIADQLGHEDLETTRIYAHVSLADRREMVEDL